ncbi:Peptide hydrolase [Mycena chlorophos]|uniref:Peptide hydrolase n=1 Tax=Mycena chlorophos TaxID=658473 RepID=A0A8H6TLH9_MYCCL|nr:Peptide hydrolase [Mycena chlorophos]
MRPTSTLLKLPNELLSQILVHVLAYSIHMAIIVQPEEDAAWHLRVHHTMSAVCYGFRETMRGISCKVFEYPPPSTPSTKDKDNQKEKLDDEDEDPETPCLASHVWRYMKVLRKVGTAIRDTSTPPNALSVDSLGNDAPQIIQSYSLYSAIVYLRYQATRANSEIYNGSSLVISGVVNTLLRVLYGRIRPSEVSVVLRRATEDERRVGDIGVSVVRTCAMLRECVEMLECMESGDVELTPEEWSLQQDLNTFKIDMLVRSLANNNVEFQTLRETADPGPLPAADTVWIGELPEVLQTVRRVQDVMCEKPGRRWALSDEATKDLEELVELWTPATESTIVQEAPP